MGITFADTFKHIDDFITQNIKHHNPPVWPWQLPTPQPLFIKQAMDMLIWILRRRLNPTTFFKLAPLTKRLQPLPLCNFQVFIYKGQLFMDSTELIPLEAGTFRVGAAAQSPKRLQFDSLLKGQTLRANYSGCFYYRFFIS